MITILPCNMLKHFFLHVGWIVLYYNYLSCMLSLSPRSDLCSLLFHVCLEQACVWLLKTSQPWLEKIPSGRKGETSGGRSVRTSVIHQVHLLMCKRTWGVVPFLLLCCNIQDVVPQFPTKCAVEWVNAEDPLFLLYTSGSTGKPKVEHCFQDSFIQVLDTYALTSRVFCTQLGVIWYTLQWHSSMRLTIRHRMYIGMWPLLWLLVVFKNL